VLDLTQLPVVGCIGAVAAGVVLPLLVYVSRPYRRTGRARSAARPSGPSAGPSHAEAAVAGLIVVASYLRDLYLDPDEQETQVTILRTEHAAADYERWLRAHESELPNGTYLLTGLASFVHYGAHIDGFRLAWFQQPLSPAWKLVREYGMQSYLPRPEPARLWRLERPDAAPTAVVHDVREDMTPVRGIDDPVALLRGGMALYDTGEYAGARAYFRKLGATSHPEAENGVFFYAASFFRQGDYPARGTS
jgi:hypothetical protein